MLNAPGREAIINTAKYDDPKDARDIAIEILQANDAHSQLEARFQRTVAKLSNNALSVMPKGEQQR